MRERVSRWQVRVIGGLALCGWMLASPVAARADTTVTINDSSRVVFATLRNGSKANTNYPQVLETRASTSGEDLRRALLKFDTHNLIPQGSQVTSAYLTVHVEDGSADASRRIGAYQVTTSWTETQTTWNQRRSGQKWGSAGGDLATLLSTATVGNSAGSKAVFDVTSLVKAAVAGQLGSSRYTRVALEDLDGATSTSYRRYYNPRANDASLRPSLVVTYASAGGPTKRIPPRSRPRSRRKSRPKSRRPVPTLRAMRRRATARRCACCIGTRTTTVSAPTASSIPTGSSPGWPSSIRTWSR